MFMAHPVVLDDLWCLDIGLWLPGVVAGGIAFPFDQILQSLPAAMVVVLLDALDLKLLFSINQFWWWLCVVRPVCISFMIGVQ
jgi:hypothetical protein